MKRTQKLSKVIYVYRKGTQNTERMNFVITGYKNFRGAVCTLI